MVKLKNILFSPFSIIIAVVLLSTGALYLPFIFHNVEFLGFQLNDIDFRYIYRNFDGILYIIPAKTWYSPHLIENLRLEFDLPLKYYAAHLPLYPLFILFLAPFVGYLKSMLAVNLIFTAMLGATFYVIVKKFNFTQYPLRLSIVLMFLPRFLIVRSVGAPESLFMLVTILSIYFFEKEKYFFASLFGFLAVVTKTPGILLFIVYLLVFLEKFIRDKKVRTSYFWIFLIPLGLISVFMLYSVRYDDFLAFFHTEGVVPMLYPFSVFNFQGKWIGTPWLEDVILYFFIYGYAVIQLFKSKHRSFFYYPLVFLIAATFVQHRDLSRYMLPIWPFVAIAFENFLTSKKFLILLIILLPALYLYAWNFMLYNTLPISDWRPFL